MKINCILIILLILFSIGYCAASTVTRSFSASEVEPSASLTVTLTVDVTGSESFYAIDESTPSGWTVSDAGTGATDQTGHIKWVVIQDAGDTSYDYTMTAPASEETTAVSGLYMFEGMGAETSIEGETQVTVAALRVEKEESGARERTRTSTP